MVYSLAGVAKTILKKISKFIGFNKTFYDWDARNGEQSIKNELWTLWVTLLELKNDLLEIFYNKLTMNSPKWCIWMRDGIGVVR